MTGGERTYRIDLGSRLAWWFIAGSLTLLGGWLLTIAFRADYPLILAVTGALFVVPGLLAVRRCLDFAAVTVSISDHGIRFGDEISVPTAWERVGSITGKAMSGDLDIFDAHGMQVGILSSSIADHDDLLQRILRRVARATPAASATIVLTAVRHRNTRWVQFIIVAYALMGLWKVQQLLIPPMMLLIGFIIWKLYAAWRMGGDRVLTIGPDGLEQRARSGDVSFKWAKIDRLDVGFGGDQMSLVHHAIFTVDQELRGSTTISLLGQDLVAFARGLRAFSGSRWDDAVLLEPPAPEELSWAQRFFKWKPERPRPAALPSAEDLVQSLKKRN